MAVHSGPAGTIGVVIPALDEAERLPATLAGLSALGACEAVVADGGSRDDTVAVARAHGARVVRAVPGRGPQCNAGAAALDTRWLLFLHADTRLPPGAGALIRERLGRTGTAAGFFRLQLDARGPAWRFIDGCALVRSWLWGQPGGDQALFCTRAAFDAAGGFPPVPLFEDLEMARRLARQGRVEPLWAPVVASARAYRAEGPWRRCWRNLVLRVDHARGVPHAELAARYARRSGRRPPAPEVVAIMARAPEHGRVKSRLAAGIGERAALAAHTALGRAVARRLAPSPGVARAAWAAITPPEQLAAAARWLGEPWRMVPQPSGDLGARMAGVIAGALACGARRVCLVGTDCAEVSAADLDDAFAALRTHDAVIGPATDGGYWLVGVSRPLPELFRGIAWGTDGVAAQTRAAAARHRLRLSELRTLADIDRPEDLAALRARLRSGPPADRALAAELP